MMKPDTLTRAWIALLLLSGGSAIIAEITGSGLDRRLTGVLIVFLALIKARVILSRYLGLSKAPTWRRGFNLTITLFCLVLVGLYLIPGFVT